MKFVVAMSNTHYGRGTPPTSAQNRANIKRALDALNLVIPNKPAYAYGDEDYGWAVPITEEEEAEILSRFPESLIEDGVVYLHDGKKNPKGTTFCDMLTVDGQQIMVTIQEAVAYNPMVTHAGEPIEPVVDRTFDAFYDDWFDNYGRY